MWKNNIEERINQMRWSKMRMERGNQIIAVPTNKNDKNRKSHREIGLYLFRIYIFFPATFSIIVAVFLTAWSVKSSIFHGVIGFVSSLCLNYVYAKILVLAYPDLTIASKNWISFAAVQAISAGLSDVSLVPNVPSSFKSKGVSLELNTLWSGLSILYVLYLFRHFIIRIKVAIVNHWLLNMKRLPHC